MNGKDGSFVMPDLSINFAFQSAQVDGGLVSGRFVVCQLGRDFGVFKPFGAWIHENLVNHVSCPNGDSW